jgi:hypothetical protein
MNQNLYSGNESGYESRHEAEETLRLVAQLPAPEELTERVHRRLHAASTSGRRGFWSLWMPAQRLQFASAALLVVAVAGSAWTVRHAVRGGAATGQPALQSSGQSIVQQPARQPAPQASGFSTAGSEARPASLSPIKVPPAQKKKPSASRTLTRKTAKPGSAASGSTASVGPAQGQSGLKP